MSVDCVSAGERLCISYVCWGFCRVPWERGMRAHRNLQVGAGIVARDVTDPFVMDGVDIVVISLILNSGVRLKTGSINAVSSKEVSRSIVISRPRARFLVFQRPGCCSRNSRRAAMPSRACSSRRPTFSFNRSDVCSRTCGPDHYVG